MPKKIFKSGDRVTRNKNHPYQKDFNGIKGTVVEVIKGKKYNRYKVKWDIKSGKWIPNFHGTFYPDKGQQHSTLRSKFLDSVN
ncbi:MAG: hypothetical protein RI945_202 [Candidatus Parcubacteria bacterium]|jgi:hypothetical protein